MSLNSLCPFACIGIVDLVVVCSLKGWPSLHLLLIILNSIPWSQTSHYDDLHSRLADEFIAVHTLLPWTWVVPWLHMAIWRTILSFAILDHPAFAKCIWPLIFWLYSLLCLCIGRHWEHGLYQATWCPGLGFAHSTCLTLLHSLSWLNALDWFDLILASLLFVYSLAMTTTRSVSYSFIVRWDFALAMIIFMMNKCKTQTLHLSCYPATQLLAEGISLFQLCLRHSCWFCCLILLLMFRFLAFTRFMPVTSL